MTTLALPNLESLGLKDSSSLRRVSVSRVLSILEWTRQLVSACLRGRLQMCLREEAQKTRLFC